MELPPIATTSVGSFPRPNWLAERERSEVRFRFDGDLLREAQDDATTLILREQENVGLDLLTDGEQRREQFIYHVLSCMEGFDFVDRRPKSIRRRSGYERPVPRVVGRVHRRAPAVVEDFRYARANTSRPLKVSVPGPVTVVDSTYDEVYQDEEALAMDVASVLNQELLELQKAGCDVLQIDEPAMTRYHEKVVAYGVRALNRCLEGISTPTILHLCYGYPGGESLQHEYEYPELISLLVEKSQIGGFSLEFARSHYNPSILKMCRDRWVMYGCVDPGDGAMESVGEVIARVQAALDYVDPARLLIAPDCGLMTLSRGLARKKVETLVEAAREVRRKL